ncbi:Metallophos_2 domain-containing protein [Vibrio phage vB_VcorM_GR11A]|nr:Metallophos_2 domain-containing protein [Vibrio phage vB_VcorM_GR11A]
MGKTKKKKDKVTKGGSLDYVAVGDWHLDKLDKRLGEDAIKLQMAEIRKACDYALDNGIKHVIYLGDTADNPRLSYRAIIAIQEHYAYYDRKGLNQHVILGNHDVEAEDFHALETLESLINLGMFDNLKFYKNPEQVWMSGVPFNFLPFPADKPIDDINAVNIAHIERPGALRDNGMKINKGGTEEDDGRKDVWDVGHLHTPHTVGRTVYAGTLYQTNFGESLPKSFLHCTATYDAKKNRIKRDYQRINNDPAFKFFNLEINELADLKKIEKNPLYLYKLYTNTDIELPKNMLTKHANVIQVLGFSSKEELKELMDTSTAKITHDVRDGLEEWLTENRGFDAKKVKRAKHLLDQAGL